MAVDGILLTTKNRDTILHGTILQALNAFEKTRRRRNARIENVAIRIVKLCSNRSPSKLLPQK
jgi:hypothetical protein